MFEELAKHKERCQREYAMKKGREEGLKQGIKQGLVQGSESKETGLIKRMLKEGTDYSFISKITGKSIEEIKEIEASL